MQIEDGTGTSYKAKVNLQNKLATISIAGSPQLHVSAADGQAYQVSSGIQTVASAGVYGILALRNDSSDNLLITYMCTAINDTEAGETQVETYLGGTWVAGTATENPVNLNGRFNLDAEVTAHYNSIPTSGELIDARWLAGPDEVGYNKEGSIILPTNGIISIKLTTETDNVKVHSRISFLLMSDDDLASF